MKLLYWLVTQIQGQPTNLVNFHWDLRSGLNYCIGWCPQIIFPEPLEKYRSLQWDLASGINHFIRWCRQIIYLEQLEKYGTLQAG